MNTTETHKILGDTIFKNIDKDKLEKVKLSNQFKNLSELLFKLKNTVNKSETFFKKELEKQINFDHLEKDDFTIIFKCI